VKDDKTDLEPKSNMLGAGGVISYGIYFAGQNFIWFLISTFMAEFFTDIDIPAAKVAFILLVVKIWGAVIDPIFGAIIDKAPFKGGKFMPWIRISVFLVPATSVLIFAIPNNISLGQKVFWALISNIIWDTAYTMCDAPAYGLITALSNKISDRNILITTNRIFAYVGSAVATGLLPTLREEMGSWLASAFYICLIAFIFMLPIAIKGKEVKQASTQTKHLKFKQILYYIRHNKFMIIFYIGTFIEEGLAINGVLNAYFARHCLSDEKLLGILSAINIAPVIVFGFFMPAILKRIDKYYIFFTSIVGVMIISFLQYFAGYKNWGIFLTFWTLRAVLLGFTRILTYAFTPDFAEYGVYKTKIPAVGITFTLQTFISKLNGALSAALGAFFLSIIGFKEGANAIQAVGFDDSLGIDDTIFQAIGFLNSIPIFWQYKLREKDIQKILKANNERV
jgi:Na+/melibiose symporter-like transporter